jgi:hypothetical protein
LEKYHEDNAIEKVVHFAIPDEKKKNIIKDI